MSTQTLSRPQAMRTMRAIRFRVFVFLLHDKDEPTKKRGRGKLHRPAHVNESGSIASAVPACCHAGFERITPWDVGYAALHPVDPCRPFRTVSIKAT